MAPEDLFDGLGFATGGGVMALFVKVMWERFVRRAEHDANAREKHAEVRADKQEARLEAFQGALMQIQQQLASLLTQLSFSQAEFKRLDERQSGMSVNYSERLARLESEVVRLKTLWETHEGDTPKP